MTEQMIYSGEVLRNWRHRLGQPMDTISKISGVAISTISMVERGLTSEITCGKIQRSLRIIEEILEASGPISQEELLARVYRYKSRVKSAPTGRAAAAAR